MTWFPPGTYRARGVSFEMGTAKTGSTRVCVVCEVEADEPPHADGDQQYQVAGAQIAWFGTLGSDAASEITLKALWTFTGADAWDGDLLTIESVIGTAVVEIVVDDDDYGNSGAPRSKVKFVNVPGVGGARLSGMDDNEKQAVAARMRGLAMSYRPGARSGATGPAGGGRGSSRPATPARAPSRAPQPSAATVTNPADGPPMRSPGEDDIPF